ncbi:MAG: DUF3098 domain-containing protein [Prevotellaceae bacterium]|jgi:hypothetical protein|nr:DUF3098 domain-containing protein [Prevotellaceae bacterium]
MAAFKKSTNVIKNNTVKKATPVKEIENKNFAMHRQSYKFMAIGCAVIVLGFLLMIGGGNTDPTQFDESKMFSFQRITLAPLIVVAGFIFVGYAIMRKPKTNK